MLLSIAGRIVTGKVGDRKVSTTALDAVMRKLFERAAGGDVPAARTVVKMAAAAEERESKAKAVLFWSAVELKVSFEQKLAAWLSNGRNEDDLRHHPGDVELDWSTYEVRLHLLLTQEQRDARAALLRQAEECEAAIRVYLALAASDGDDPVLQLAREVARGTIEAINGSLPARLRRTPLGETPPDWAKAAMEAPSEATLEAFQRWLGRMEPHLRATFKKSERPSS